MPLRALGLAVDSISLSLGGALFVADFGVVALGAVVAGFNSCDTGVANCDSRAEFDFVKEPIAISTSASPRSAKPLKIIASGFAKTTNKQPSPVPLQRQCMRRQ